MKKRALITGITGQDGSYLAELLLSKRATRFTASSAAPRRSTPTASTISIRIRTRPTYAPAACLRRPRTTPARSISSCATIQPDEIYNLGAQSHVRVSFDVPEYTAEVTGLGTVRLLEAIRETGINAEFYQASSSELYGKVAETPQTRDDALLPAQPVRLRQGLRLLRSRSTIASPTACSPCNGILFNHESRAARRDVRHAQDHARRDAHQARPAAEALPGQPRRAARLGLRAATTSRRCG